ncbi:LAFE_0G04896g1_1 [Lachancea fermentati]|uniref:Vacuolar protein sorting-associated protein 35 n=1 Tax=Lachancea fermentati TaxID=4955 RepID=A0A1G4MHA9_LACFM|nr:LAFE_0G04896g1_1 [Lachancea fermentati]
MSYAETIEDAIGNIKQQTVLMQRCLSQGKLMDALKHTSIMLTELRNPALSPKQYYELYIMAYDSLSILSNYLVESHPKRHHLADLYELVQYAGNILPRLYLMITVGSSYLQSPDAPREEILKDMIEMCRGVQNPIRGLFLRYYLSQRTKQFLETDAQDKKFCVNFIITNFIEMNKLWVRLQHQGPLREREQRTRERKELQILIGANLVRLSQIVENDFALYTDEILPLVLEQVIQCRDVVSQEYLLDVICQVFPDEFHLGTLSELLNATLKLNPEVSINKVVLTLVDRLNGYLDRQENADEQSISEKLKTLKISDESCNLFLVFWKYLTKLNEERPDLSLQELAPLIQGVLKLSLRWYPANIKNVDVLYNFMLEKCKDYGKPIPEDWNYLFQDLLLVQDIIYDPNFLYTVITQCHSYQKLLSLQSVGLQKEVVKNILELISQAEIRITSKDELEKVLLICESVIKGSPTSTETSTSNLMLDNEDDLDSEDWVIQSDQEKLAKISHICYNKSIDVHAELLLSCKNWFYRGGKNIKYTYPAIICNFWRLIRKCNLKARRKPKLAKKLSAMTKQLFKYVSRCINDMFNVCGNGCSDLIYKLNLQTASLADQLTLGEIAYDFFSQAFTIFEESLSDSRTQFQAIVNMAQILQKTRFLYEESYYDTLITRCTLHGSKLLKKQDQCRAVYVCSHLWWATEISLLGEEEGITENFFREGKRVLECLQRSLRVADSIMDNVQSCELMVEILNRCCYYFIHGDENATHVGVKYINGLIELIETNLKSLKMEESGTDAEPIQTSREHYYIGIDGSYIHQSPINSVSAVSTKPPTAKINDLIPVPTEHFERTLKYITEQGEVDGRFKALIM